MGSVFGKETVAEPAFDILLNRTSVGVQAQYQIRKYGERFAAEVSYLEGEDTGSPFRALAGYIGVFGQPQNEGKEAMSMTAPVVIEGNGEGTKIAMTAPVVTENDSSNKDGKKVMKFILPAEYDDMSKIPKPTNPTVHIEEIPSQVGAVHRYAGSFQETSNRLEAAKFAKQLMEDGVEGISEEYVLEHCQFWGYNPPFTLPMFRRNEVWVELSESQVDHLLSKYRPDASN